MVRCQRRWGMRVAPSPLNVGAVLPGLSLVSVVVYGHRDVVTPWWGARLQWLGQDGFDTSRERRSATAHRAEPDWYVATLHPSRLSPALLGLTWQPIVPKGLRSSHATSLWRNRCPHRQTS